MNWLIRFLAYFAKPIDGNPNQWLERPYKLAGEWWREFRCGSCKGIYRVKDKEFQILAVHNTKKNDNFDRTLDWFKKSCAREKFSLSFLEVGNPALKAKLEKLGFIGNNVKMTLNTK